MKTIVEYLQKLEFYVILLGGNTTQIEEFSSHLQEEFEDYKHSHPKVTISEEEFVTQLESPKAIAESLVGDSLKKSRYLKRFLLSFQGLIGLSLTRFRVKIEDGLHRVRIISGKLVAVCGVVTLVILIISLPLLAPTDTNIGEIPRARSYGGRIDDYDSCFDLIQTFDGGLALVGVTGGRLLHTSDMWLIKVNPNGDVEWNQTYGNASDLDEARSIIQTTDGGFALTGITRRSDARYDFLLIKTDANGKEEWNRTYGGSENDQAYSLIQTSDGGFVLAGETRSFGAGSADCWLLKTDSNGLVQWNHTYGGEHSDKCHSIIQTSDQGFAFAGRTSSESKETYLWLVKTDSNGTEQWNRTYGGSTEDVVYALIQTSDGGFALAGHTDSNYMSEIDRNIETIILVKTDSNGTVQWNQTYGGMGDDRANDLIQTNDGGFALAARTHWEKTTVYALLVKTDEGGIAQWNQTYAHSYGYTLIQTSDGGFVLGGSTKLSSNDEGIILGETSLSDNMEVLLVRTDATGSPLVFPSPELSPDLRIIPLLAAVVMLVCLAILVHQNLRKRRKQLQDVISMDCPTSKSKEEDV